ncbi:Uncharacterised protein [uncultured archaeon]|nr:Uncharacterised protein [uncultured archaeon]
MPRNLVCLATSIVIGLLFGATSEAAHAEGNTIDINGILNPSVEVMISRDECIWELSPREPGIYTKTCKLAVRSNANWILTVTEENSLEGYMTEWNGERYGSERLSIPMKVKANEEVTLPNHADMPLQTGSRTGSRPHEVDFAFVQLVTEDDTAKSKDRAYRMVVTFTGSPAV